MAEMSEKQARTTFSYRRLRIGSMQNGVKENPPMSRQRITSDTQLQHLKRTRHVSHPKSVVPRVVQRPMLRRPALVDVQNTNPTRPKVAAVVAVKKRTKINTPVKPKVKRSLSKGRYVVPHHDVTAESVFVTRDRRQVNAMADQSMMDRVDHDESWFDEYDCTVCLDTTLLPSRASGDSSDCNLNKRKASHQSDDDEIRSCKKRLKKSRKIDYYSIDDTTYLADLVMYKMATERASLYMDKSMAQNRKIVINWLIDVHNDLGSCPEVLFASVNLLDGLLQLHGLRWQQLQLASLACYRLVSKFNDDIVTPGAMELLDQCDQAYSIDEFNKMEKYIFVYAGHLIDKPEPMLYVHYYVHYLKLSNTKLVVNLSNYFLDCILLEEEYVLSTPSHLAAAAVYTASEILGNPLAMRLCKLPSVKYSLKEVRPLKEKFLSAARKMADPQTSQRAPFLKYNTVRYNFLTELLSD